MNVKCTHPNCYRKANSKGFCPIHRPQPIKGDRTVKAVITNLKKQAIQRKRKVTGEGELFKEIAQERPHVCFVTGTPVNVYNQDGRLNVSCFAHLVSKGSRTDLRLLKKNIVIVLPRVHHIYDKGNRQERAEMEQYEGWHNLHKLHDLIIEENNRDNKNKSYSEE